jgi:dephospho-CoA kinase
MQDDLTFRVGLTGGIASGKSTVARYFADCDIPVIDTDVIAREVVEPGQPALQDITDAFGLGVITPDGALDRKALRHLVFASDSARFELEAILHPIIRDETVRQARAAGGAYQIIVVPLLVESPLKLFVQRILVVDCDEEVQIQRVMKRDNETRDQARRILRAQTSRERRLSIANDVIDNRGSLDDLRARVNALDEKYRLLAKKYRHGF